MNDINVNVEGVASTFSQVLAVYADIEEKITELNEKKGEITSFWDSKEAAQFISQLDIVSSMLQSFSTEFDTFKNSINNILSVYNDQETYIVDSINAYASDRN